MVGDRASVISSGRCVIWSWNFVIFPILSLVFRFCGVVYLRIEWDLVCFIYRVVLGVVIGGGIRLFRAMCFRHVAMYVFGDLWFAGFVPWSCSFFGLVVLSDPLFFY
jgi:hypothetical protein